MSNLVERLREGCVLADPSNEFDNSVDVDTADELMNQAAARIIELEAENKRLKEALKPFEQKGRFSWPDETRVEIVACDSNRQNWFMDAVKLGDLRRAAALGEKP